MGTAARSRHLDFSQPHVLRNEREYDKAVAWADTLTDDMPAKGTKDYDALRFILLLIEAYDDEHYPMGDKSTAQDVVEFMLEQKGKTRGDLAGMLGGRSRVSEFFTGKRRLSIEQVRTLRDELGIPADLLIE
ncbi:MAG: helix-turn-helix domain-containing protein [Gemmatimonadales bacterium]